MAESKSRNINKAFTPTGKIEAASVVTTTGVAAVGDAPVVEADIFRINPQNLSINHTIDSADNAMSAGPITVDSGVTLTVNGYWSVV